MGSLPTPARRPARPPTDGRTPVSSAPHAHSHSRLIAVCRLRVRGPSGRVVCVFVAVFAGVTESCLRVRGPSGSCGVCICCRVCWSNRELSACQGAVGVAAGTGGVAGPSPPVRPPVHRPTAAQQRQRSPTAPAHRWRGP